MIVVPFFVLLLASVAEAHSRWRCPLPRDENDVNGTHDSFENTGNKYGPCGPMSGMWGFGTVTTIQPGWQTFVWEESVGHAGSPYRLAILNETEHAKIILLDHIPHNDNAHPTPYDESTYVPYKMTVNIPDVYCEKCSLQLLFVMTDKTVPCGIETCYYNPEDSACSGYTEPGQVCPKAPTDVPCVQENECFSNYHSCTDVMITGTIPIEEANFGQPDDWPYSDLPEQYYGLETADWKNGWLKDPDVPAVYTTPVEGQCYTSDGKNDDDDDQATETPVIIGVAVGAGVLAIAGVGYFLKTRSSKPEDSPATYSKM